jgi:TolB-like protein/tetratricopeptide (TPR) repeat protein
MTTKSASPVTSASENLVSEEPIRRELKRILVSRSFRQVDRLQRFLSFIVEETLSGRGDRLKEYPVGVDVFGKDQSFDPRMDPIVRVQARRLRIRLTTYYQDEGQNDEVIIELPKGGYAPIFRRSESTTPAKKPSSIALVSRNTVMVRPFDDYSGSSNQDYFCKGLSQEIVHGLSQVDSIVVVSRDPSADARGPEGTPSAAIVVTGSVRKARDTVRVTTQLTDTVRGCYLWSDTVDGKIDDTLSIQTEVARSVVQTVRQQLLGGGLPKKGGHRPTENLAALNMYLQGRYHLDQRTEQGLRKALEFFEKAIAEDPQFADAYAGLSDAHGLLGHYGVTAPASVWTRAASNATQAVLLDDESAEAHTSLAHVRSTQDWDWAGAEREFRRAISLNPRLAPAHHWYAVSCLAPLGRLDEALEELLLAQALDPVSSIISRNIAVLHYYLRDYENAMEQCDRTIEQNPHFAPAYWTLGLIQEQRGDFDESIAAFQRAIDLSPPNPRILGALGRTFARAGRKDEALRILHELDELAKRRYISPFEQALIYFALGRMDEGFERLSKAYQDRCFELITVKVDPQFDSVKKDARFKTLFQQLGLP